MWIARQSANPGGTRDFLSMVASGTSRRARGLTMSARDGSRAAAISQPRLTLRMVAPGPTIAVRYSNSGRPEKPGAGHLGA